MGRTPSLVRPVYRINPVRPWRSARKLCLKLPNVFVPFRLHLVHGPNRPLECFQRTALVDTEVGGVTVRQGQRVGLFYSSANYDDEVFEKPFEFNILRNPNPHLAFGGNGAHFCIGANLARMEIKLMFNEIADQIPDISKLAEPQRLRSGWINGVKDLQVSYH